MIVVREEYCPKNHRCPTMDICPVEAITQKNKNSAPEVDNEKCVECQECVRACQSGVFTCIECGHEKKTPGLLDVDK